MKAYSTVVVSLSICILGAMQNVFKARPGISVEVEMALCAVALVAAGCCIYFVRQTKGPDNMPPPSVDLGRRQFTATVFGLAGAALLMPFVCSPFGPAFSLWIWCMISASTFGFSVVAAFITLKIISR